MTKILACVIALAVSAAALPAFAETGPAPSTANGGPSVKSGRPGAPSATHAKKHRKHKHKKHARRANRAPAPTLAPN